MHRWLLAVLALALVSGCASVPVIGPVREVTAHPARVNPGVEIAPAPPGQDVGPGEVVEGFLHAMAAHQPDFSVARAYLTPDANESWRPEAGVSIYAEGYSVSVNRGDATLEAPMVARLTPDGALNQASGMLRHDFVLVEDEHGQWRISNPPDGLMVSQYLFASSFDENRIYFWGENSKWLVPDLRYFRRGALGPLAAARAVVAGPSEWLEPVVSRMPSGLTVEDVEIGISGNALITIGGGTSLSVAEQSALAVQMVWTLRQFPAIAGISLRYEGQDAWNLPESVSGVVPTSAYADADPVERIASHQLFAISEGTLVRVGEGAQGVELTDAGVKLSDIEWAALRSDARQAVVVSGGELHSVSMVSGLANPILAGESLRQPEFSRFGEIWVPDGSPTVKVLLDDESFDVKLDGVTGGRILEIEVSPEGARAALVIEDAAGKRRAGVALIIRNGQEIALRGWRPLFLAVSESQTEPDVLDIGWSSTDSLTLLVKDVHGSGVLTVGSDGASPTSMGPVRGSELVEIAVAPDAPLIVRSTSGQAFRYYADYRWALIGNDITSVIYPG